MIYIPRILNAKATMSRWLMEVQPSACEKHRANET
jgi:hypothetical protein